MKFGRLVVFCFLFAASTNASEPRKIYLFKMNGDPQFAKAFLPPEADLETCGPGFSAYLTTEEAARLKTSGLVAYLEPDQERHVSSFTSHGPLAISLPQQLPYGVVMVNAQVLWPRAKGKGTKVAIIDTGIDKTHPDLAANYKGGIDYVNNDADPQDDNGHGTHVAGIIAAADNDLGVVGVAPEASIYAVKVLAANGKGSARNIIRGVQWAIDNHMDVVNLSLGGEDPSSLEADTFANAALAGVMVFAASGNDGKAQVDFPAAYPWVTAVGAIGANRSVASFSNFGPQLLLVGPGVMNISTYLQGQGVSAAIGVDGSSIEAEPLDYAAYGTVTAPVVDCQLGRPGDYPADAAGKIALVARGEISFFDKVAAAKSAHVAAVVISNNSTGNFVGTLGAADATAPIVVTVSQEDGPRIKAAKLATITSTNHENYEALSGTSMSTPHVAGVAALLKSVFPKATRGDILSAMYASAIDLGDHGRDAIYGFGLADAAKAAEWIEKPKTKGRAVGK